VPTRVRVGLWKRLRAKKGRRFTYYLPLRRGEIARSYENLHIWSVSPYEQYLGTSRWGTWYD